MNFGVVEKQFEYRGHDCICIFNKHGFRCGYVSVDTDKDYMDFDIDCHGGLTWSGKVYPYYNPKSKYYIGFDCYHIGDACDMLQALKYNLITQEEFDKDAEKYSCSFEDVVRDVDFVEDNCRKIVDQLEDIINKKTNDEKPINNTNDIKADTDLHNQENIFVWHSGIPKDLEATYIIYGKTRKGEPVYDIAKYIKSADLWIGNLLIPMQIEHVIAYTPLVPYEGDIE